MKKITKTLLCLSSICLLAGCAKEVTADEAKAAVRKANEKTPDISTVYTGVKLTTKVDTLKGTGTFGSTLKSQYEKIYGVEGTETSLELTFTTNASEIAIYRLSEDLIDEMLAELKTPDVGLDSYAKFYLDGDALSINVSIATSFAVGESALTMYSDVEYKTNADMTLSGASTHIYFNSESDSFDYKISISTEWMK